MARLFSDSSATFFVLLGLAACIMLATSAPTVQRVHVREATTIAIYLDSGVRLSVSYCKHVFFLFKVSVLLDGMVSAVCRLLYESSSWRHTKVQHISL